MTSNVVEEPREPHPLTHSLELGVASGIVAGSVYLIAACVISRLTGGHVESPLRLPAAVVFGPAALGSFFPIWQAAFVGVGVDLTISAILGIVWVMTLRRMRWIQAGPLALAPFGAGFGALTWLVGDVLLGALAFPQIAVTDLLLGGAIAHAVFFGGALAAAVVVLRSNRGDT